jgi:hypothetical protein
MMEAKKLKVVVKDERNLSNGKVRIQRPVSAVPKKGDVSKGGSPQRNNIISIKKNSKYINYITIAMIFLQ